MLSQMHNQLGIIIKALVYISLASSNRVIEQKQYYDTIISKTKNQNNNVK